MLKVTSNRDSGLGTPGVVGPFHLGVICVRCSHWQSDHPSKFDQNAELGLYLLLDLIHIYAHKPWGTLANGKRDETPVRTFPDWWFLKIKFSNVISCHRSSPLLIFLQRVFPSHGCCRIYQLHSCEVLCLWGMRLAEEWRQCVVFYQNCKAAIWHRSTRCGFVEPLRKKKWYPIYSNLTGLQLHCQTECSECKIYTWLSQ